MKRVRWNNGELQWDDGPGSVPCSDPGGVFETDYRGFEWRELQGVEYVPETEVIRLVLKPVVPKQPTVLEAAKNLINSNFYGMNEVQYAALTELHKAIHREEANPTKPAKYGHIPQRLLDAIDPSAVDGGTRAILLVRDGGWAVKDFPAGVDTEKVYLWSGKYSIESVRDEIKQRGAANA